MLRHDRGHVFHHRNRIIALRRRRLAHWLSSNDSTREAPRPLWVRVAEFWDARRLGRLAKYNGACGCWMCKQNAGEYEREGFHRETRRLLAETLIS